MRHLHRPIALAALAALTACGGSGDESPTPTASASFCAEMLGTEDAPVCVIEGEHTEDLTLTADRSYLLRGGVFIGDDVNPTTLTIEPGVTVYGELSSKAFLTIRRSARLVADGTADAPILFTSAAAPGDRARGDWGGIILNGRAPINTCGGAGCTAEGEGGTGTYGGDDEDDDSGVLRYVRVEFAGNQISTENELNGIAFQGVGRGTVVDYVQAHMGADDGLEFFGGTVDARHVVITGAADDNLDWTYGWRGRLQFAVIQQYDAGGDNGIEADNYDGDNAATPRSAPTLANLTLIGSPASSDSDVGVLLREGTGGHLYNTIVVGFNEGCLDVTDEVTFDNAQSGDLTVSGSILWCATPFIEEEGDGVDLDTWFLEDQAGNLVVEPMLAAPYDLADPGFAPTEGSPARQPGVTISDTFFEDVDYVGGVDPQEDWTAGWTTSDPS